MKGRMITVASVLGALAMAGCGSSGGNNAGGGNGPCVASIGLEVPITGPVAVLGQEQLHFAQLALKLDNKANKTKIIAVVGPAGSQEVEAAGPLMARAGLAFISGSATNVTLTQGKYPTFFRVVSNDRVQGQNDANYIVKNLHPKAVMIVDDQEVYSTGLV